MGLKTAFLFYYCHLEGWDFPLVEGVAKPSYLPGPSKVSHRCLQFFSFWKNTEKNMLANRVNSQVRQLSRCRINTKVNN